MANGNRKTPKFLVTVFSRFDCAEGKTNWQKWSKVHRFAPVGVGMWLGPVMDSFLGELMM